MTYDIGILVVYEYVLKFLLLQNNQSFKILFADRSTYPHSRSFPPSKRVQLARTAKNDRYGTRGSASTILGYKLR